MKQARPGDLARSLCGADKGNWYLIASVEDSWLYLCDGERRPLEKAKRKKRMHVQLCYQKDTHIIEAAEKGALTNEEIRHVLEAFTTRTAKKSPEGENHV